MDIGRMTRTKITRRSGKRILADTICLRSDLVALAKESKEHGIDEMKMYEI